MRELAERQRIKLEEAEAKLKKEMLNVFESKEKMVELEFSIEKLEVENADLKRLIEIAHEDSEMLRERIDNMTPRPNESFR